MFWFATWINAAGETMCERFNTIELLWKWLDEYRGNTGQYPAQLCVYKGECVFDGS